MIKRKLDRDVLMVHHLDCIFQKDTVMERTKLYSIFLVVAGALVEIHQVLLLIAWIDLKLNLAHHHYGMIH